MAVRLASDDSIQKLITDAIGPQILEEEGGVAGKPGRRRSRRQGAENRQISGGGDERWRIRRRRPPETEEEGSGGGELLVDRSGPCAMRALTVAPATPNSPPRNEIL
jgi:hypothetical protein